MSGRKNHQVQGQKEWIKVKYLMDQDKQRLTQEAAEYRTSLKAIEGDLKRSALPIMEMEKLSRKLHEKEMPFEVRLLSQELDVHINALCEHLGFSFKMKDGSEILQLLDRQGSVLVEWDQTIVEDESSVR